MKKILKSAEAIFNDAIEKCQQFGEHYYDDGNCIVYWEDDGHYYSMEVDSPDCHPLRDILDMLNDVDSYIHLSDALDFYDCGNECYDNWSDYLDWYIDGFYDDGEEIKPEVEEYDTSDDFEAVAKLYKGKTFEEIFNSLPEDRKKLENDYQYGCPAIYLEYNGLKFRILKRENGKVVLLEYVDAWDESVFDKNDMEKYYEVVLYEANKFVEYKMDEDMAPFDKIIATIKEQILADFKSFAPNVNIDPHYQFLYRYKGMEDSEWDVVTVSMGIDAKLQVSLIEGTIEEPTASVDIDLDTFPVEELIRMYNSI